MNGFSEYFTSLMLEVKQFWPQFVPRGQKMSAFGFYVFFGWDGVRVVTLEHLQWLYL